MDPYNYTYYGDYQKAVPVPDQEGGCGGGVSYQDVQDAIDNALSKIGLVKTDDDSYAFSTDTGESGSATIDDIYLHNVERDDDQTSGEKRIKFNMTNGSGFTVPLDMLDDPIIDCNTF